MPTNDKMIDDPDVKVPGEVQKQIDRANAIFEQMKAQQEGQPQPEPQPAPPTLEETLETEEAPNPEQDPARLLESAGTEQPGSEEAEGEPEEEESWEHKYKSIHGRYKSLQQSTRAMQEQISNMQQVLATLQQPAVTSEVTPEVTQERLITPEEENDYGKDMLTVVGKRAREEISPLLSAQAKKIADLEAKLNGVNGHLAQNSQEKMLATMDSRMPDWRETNRSSEFLDWLSLPDAYSGAIRHNLLKAAYAAGDASRVLAFFNGFLAEEAATSPAPAQPDPGAPPARRVPKIPLASLAAPGRAKTAAASGPPAEKPIITRAQIATFYADAAAGKYRGRDDLKNNLEQQIFAAQREGRIQ
jgi:hypothetical protein